MWIYCQNSTDRINTLTLWENADIVTQGSIQGDSGGGSIGQCEKKKLYKNICIILNVYRDTAVWICKYKTILNCKKLEITVTYIFILIQCFNDKFLTQKSQICYSSRSMFAESQRTIRHLPTRTAKCTRLDSVRQYPPTTKLPTNKNRHSPKYWGQSNNPRHTIQCVSAAVPWVPQLSLTACPGGCRQTCYAIRYRAR